MFAARKYHGGLFGLLGRGMPRAYSKGVPSATLIFTIMVPLARSISTKTIPLARFIFKPFEQEDVSKLLV